MAKIDHEKNNRRIKSETPSRKTNFKSPKRRRYCSKYDGTCSECQGKYVKGQFIIYDFTKRTGKHEDCNEEYTTPIEKKTEVKSTKSRVKMKSKFTSRCSKCNTTIPKNSDIYFELHSKRAMHIFCG